MINFVESNTIGYKGIFNSFIEPVTKYLDSFSISDRCMEDCINVHMTMEDNYRTAVDFKGFNVLLPHGIADKNLRNANQVNMFDKVIVSGTSWVTKLTKQGLDNKKIFIGGYPKLDMVKRQSNNADTVLWAPTHSLSYGTSYPALQNFFSTLPYKTQIALHPYDKQKQTNCGEPTTNELTDARVVIADSGSIIYEAWALGIPVIFPDWLTKESVVNGLPGSFEAQIYNDKIGYHAKDEREFIDLLEFVYDTRMLCPKVKRFIIGIISIIFVGRSGKIIADYLLELDSVN